MLRSRRRSACFIVLLIATTAAACPVLAGDAFPFGSELMLEAAAMPGSKRIPMLEIEDDGTASIDLWCTSLHAQATVTANSIAIVPGQAESQVQAPQCDPERQADDATLLAALTEATKWRRSGDRVELSGGATLHYRLMTN